jgi:hypothetical protein
MMVVRGAGGKRELWVVDDKALLSTWPGERLDQGYLDGIVDYCAFFIARRGCVVGPSRITVIMMYMCKKAVVVANRHLSKCGFDAGSDFGVEDKAR